MDDKKKRKKECEVCPVLVTLEKLIQDYKNRNMKDLFDLSNQKN